jgi:hypothetical protein
VGALVLAACPCALYAMKSVVRDMQAALAKRQALMQDKDLLRMITDVRLQELTGAYAAAVLRVRGRRFAMCDDVVRVCAAIQHHDRAQGAGPPVGTSPVLPCVGGCEGDASTLVSQGSGV